MKTLLEAKNLTKIFSRHGQSNFTAVDRVSFTLFAGEALGIVGESGSGKSTVAKIITRLIDATSGQVWFKQKNISSVTEKELRAVYQDIQMVFQSPFSSFDPRRTLGSSVGESLRNNGVSYKETKTKVASLFQQCGLSPEYIEKFPYEVSGGQCQRAAIARALAVCPQILICDEITSSLDVTVQAQILDLLRSLQQAYGMSFLFICHDIALVQSFCDRVLVMHQGKIVEQGSTETVIMNPTSDYTKELLQAVL